MIYEAKVRIMRTQQGTQLRHARTNALRAWMQD